MSSISASGVHLEVVSQSLLIERPSTPEFVLVRLVPEFSQVLALAQ